MVWKFRISEKQGCYESLSTSWEVTHGIRHTIWRGISDILWEANLPSANDLEVLESKLSPQKYKARVKRNKDEVCEGSFVITLVSTY